MTDQDVVIDIATDRQLDDSPSEENRRILDSKDTGRLFALLRGPFVQHNYVVRCADTLRMLNVESDVSNRMWRILPTGCVNSQIGDACATITWVILIILPFMAITVGCFCPYRVNIIIGVTASIVMMAQLVIVYLIWKNYKKLCRLWYVSKVNMKHYLGWKNQGKVVTKETINNLHLVSADKRKGLICKLGKSACETVTVMVYTQSFWTYHVLDPVIALIFLSALELAAVVVQLEMLRHTDHG